ncbi:hypothetical protein F4805DRAFT_478808 [Annulohypoxylon moriforme]|nr:hypothetical protein F4805DRAFT_478808 [Annulohypoxylon moriforme]
MHKQPEFLRPDELLSISPSADPISANSTMNSPLPSARMAAILPKRAKSLYINRMLVLRRDEDSSTKSVMKRGRSTSPLRANVKRRRSVASAPEDVLRRLSSRRNDVQPHDGAEFKSQIQETMVLQQKETVSECSGKRRTSHVDDTELKKLRSAKGKNSSSNKPAIERSESIKRSLKVTKGSKLSVVPPLSLSGGTEDEDRGEEEETYERKGVFRLKKDKGPDEFRFPKSQSHPEPLWRAGDGFAAGEARPDFAFLMTGKQKQKKSRSTPSVGELQLETNDGNEEGPRRSGGSRRKNQRFSHYEVKHRRGVAKDVWPTIDNFSEELEVRKWNPTVPANEKIISSTVKPQPTPVPRARDTFEYNPPPITRKRRDSDFENFGGRLGNSDIMNSTCITETQIDLTQHDIQSGSEGDESFDNEAEEESEGRDEDYEPLILTQNHTEVDDNSENSPSDEENVSGAASIEESSIRSSAISALDDTNYGPLELGQHYGDISAAGDVARELLDISQAFS